MMRVRGANQAGPTRIRLARGQIPAQSRTSSTPRLKPGACSLPGTTK